MRAKKLQFGDRVFVLVRLPGIVVGEDDPDMAPDPDVHQDAKGGHRIALNASLQELTKLAEGLMVERNRILAEPHREDQWVKGKDLPLGTKVEADFLLAGQLGCLPDSAQRADYELVLFDLDGPTLHSLYAAGELMPRPRIHKLGPKKA
jgi:hypothetical protein